MSHVNVVMARDRQLQDRIRYPISDTALVATSIFPGLRDGFPLHECKRGDFSLCKTLTNKIKDWVIGLSHFIARDLTLALFPDTIGPPLKKQ